MKTKLCLLFCLLTIVQTKFLNGQTDVSGQSTSGLTVWSQSMSPIIVNNTFTVIENDTLIIEAGVEVNIGNSDRIIIHGTIRAEGTISDSIKFRGPEGSSFNYGRGLDFGFSSKKNYLSYAEFKYLGGDGYGAIHAVYPLDAITPLLVENCNFSHNEQNAEIHVENLGGFQDNDIGRIHITGSPIGQATLYSQSESEVTQYMHESALTIHEGDTLIIKAGVEYQFRDAERLNNNGTIIANGTEIRPVRMIGVDSDFNDEGYGIVFGATSTSNILDHIHFERLGKSSYYGAIHAGSIMSGDSPLIVTNCTFSSNKRNAEIHVENLGGFRDNDIGRIFVAGSPIGQATLYSQSESEVTQYMHESALTIHEGDTLIIKAGVEYQFRDAERLNNNGTIIANGTEIRPVRMIGVDSDFNDEGYGIVFGATSTSNILDHIHFERLGKSSYYGAIHAGSIMSGDSPLIVTNCTFSSNKRNAEIHVENLGGFRDNDIGRIFVAGSPIGQATLYSQSESEVTQYMHESALTIHEGDTLIIEAGVEYQFRDAERLNNNGTIIANGTEIRPVRMIGVDSDFNDEGYGIVFGATSTSNILDHIHFERLGKSSYYGAIHAGSIMSGDSPLIVTNCTFSSNKRNAEIHVENLGGFRDNDIGRIFVAGSPVGQATLYSQSESEVTQYMHESALTIHEGDTLIIEAGVEYQFRDAERLNNNGTIIANGTEIRPVRMIGVDSDFNDEGYGIVFGATSTSNILDHIHFERLGKSSYYGAIHAGSIMSGDSPLIVTNCTFSSNKRNAEIHVENLGGFRDNDIGRIFVAGSPVGQATLYSQSESEVTQYMHESALTIHEGDTLIIEAGVEYQFRDAERLNNNGTIIANGTEIRPVRMIGVDSDFNDEGYGIVFEATSTSNILDRVHFERLGKFGNYGAIHATNPMNGDDPLTVTNCTFSLNDRNAEIHVENLGGFQDNDIGRIFIAGSPIGQATLYSQSESEVTQYMHESTLTIPEGDTLIVEAGVEYQFRDAGWLDNKGTIIANGTEMRSVRMIGIDPDFNDEGYGIVFGATSTSNILDWVHFEKLGKFSYYGAIHAAQPLSGSTPLIVTNCTFSLNDRNAEIHVENLGGFQNNAIEKIFITGAPIGQATLPSQSDTELTKYEHIGTLVIPENDTLMIEDGVEFQLRYQVSLINYGTLIANGTENRGIKIIGNNANSNYRGRAIFFQETSKGNILDYVHIEQLGDGSYAAIYAVDAIGGVENLKVRNCTFSNNAPDIYLHPENAGGFANNLANKIEFTGASIARNAYFPGNALIGGGKFSASFNILETGSLTIGAGAEIQFDDRRIITAEGTVIAEGTIQDTIRFTGVSSNLNTMGGGIVLAANNNRFSHVKFSRVGDNATTMDCALYIEGENNEITNCSFINSETTGICVLGEAIISNCTFNNNHLYGIRLQDAESVSINNCTFENNSEGIRKNQGASIEEVHNCNFHLSNSNYGIQNTTANDIDATGNWWGSEFGPTHLTNPAGQGSIITDHVIYDPYIQDQIPMSQNDLQLVSILSPYSDCELGTNETVTFSVFNNGEEVYQDLNFGLIFNGDTITTQDTIGVNLEFAQTVLLQVQTPLNLSIEQDYTISVFVEANEDENPYNNHRERLITHFAEIDSTDTYSGVFPPNGIQNIPRQVNLSWSPIDHADYYDIYLWNTNEDEPPAPFASEFSGINYDINQNLNFATTYKWKVVARNICSPELQSNWYEFTTISQPDVEVPVDSISVPQQIYSGQSIEVGWDISNVGTFSTGNEDWRDAVYLSVDPSYGGDTYLGIASNPISLNAGESYSQTLSINIPIGYEGNYYLIIVSDRYNYLNESNESNNIGILPIEIILTDPPDLQVTSVYATFGSIVTSEQEVEINWTVINNGTGQTLSDYWVDRIFIADTNVFNASSALPISNHQHNGILDVEESYTASKTITIPQGYDGSYYVFVQTDRYDYVYEHYTSNENNNISPPYELDVTILPPSDLEIEIISHPIVANNKEEVLVTYKVTNSKEPFSNRSITDRIYLSSVPDATIYNSQYLGQVTAQRSLGFEESYTASKTVTIPNNLTGEYYFYIITDATNNLFEWNYEFNNDSTSSISLTIQHSDLDIAEFNSPTLIASGETAIVYWSVLNSGLGSVENINRQDRIYLSGSQGLQGAQYLGSVNYNTSHLTGDTINKSLEIVIPIGIEGSKYLIVFTDYNNSVFENGSDLNNIQINSVNISPYIAPDLEAISLEGVPDALIAGDVINITYEVSNSSEITLSGENWRDRIFLSATDQWQQGDPRIIIENFNISELLGPDETYQRELEFELPMLGNDAPFGVCFLYVHSDYAGNIYEDEEVNNLIVSQGILVTAPDPLDFEVNTAYISEEVVTEGYDAEITWRVTNLGTSTEVWNYSLWYDAIYLSLDTIWDNSDNFITDFTVTESLETLENYQKTQSFQVPYDLPEEFFFLLVTDHLNYLNDSYQDNNVWVMDLEVNIENPDDPDEQGTYDPGPIIPLEIDYPDFELDSLNVTSQFIAGQPYEASWIVRNIGAGNSDQSNITDKVYLSIDNEIDGSDFLIGTVNHDAPFVGDMVNVYNSLSIPLNIQGNYFLIVKTDANNSVFEESSESNNVKTSLVSVSQSSPGDLSITDVIIQDSIDVGGITAVSWRLENQGENPISGTMKEVIYISQDTIWDVSDTYLTDINSYVDLAPNASIFQSAQAEAPGIPIGNYHLIVKTDALDNFSEINEENNETASTELIKISLDELVIGVEKPASTINGQESFYKICVPDSVDGASLIVKLESLSIDASNELYLSYGHSPTRSDHDYASVVPYLQNQELIVPELIGGEYYLLVVGNDSQENTQDIGLLAEILPFLIREVNTNIGGNTGSCTALISGAQFEDNMLITLQSEDEEIIASNSYFINSAEVYATFDLYGKISGVYDVKVILQNEEEAVLVDGFTVIEGAPLSSDFGGFSGGGNSELSCSIQNSGAEGLVTTLYNHPANTRINRVVPIAVTWQYNGNVDIINPTKLVWSLRGAPLAFEVEELEEKETELLLEFTEEDGPPNIVRPGASGTINFFSYSSDPLRFKIVD